MAGEVHDLFYRTIQGFSDGNCKQKFYYGSRPKGRDCNRPSAEHEAVTENKQTT